MVVEKTSPTYFNISFWFPSGPVLQPFRSDFGTRWISSGVTGLRSGHGSPVKDTSGSSALSLNCCPNHCRMVSAFPWSLPTAPSASCTHSGGGRVVALMVFTAWNMRLQLSVELLSVVSWSRRLFIWMFFYSAVSSPWDCSKLFTLHPLADHAAITARRLFVHISTGVCSHVLMYTAE